MDERIQLTFPTPFGTDLTLGCEKAQLKDSWPPQPSLPATRLRGQGENDC